MFIDKQLWRFLFICNRQGQTNSIRLMNLYLWSIFSVQIFFFLLTSHSFSFMSYKHCFSHRKLTGIKITSEEDAIEAMKILHSKGPKIVVISSSEFSPDGSIISLASTVASRYKGPIVYSSVYLVCFFLFIFIHKLKEKNLVVQK